MRFWTQPGVAVWNDATSGQLAAHLRGAANWPEVAAFAAVQRCGVRDGKRFCHDSWLILTACIDAVEVAHLIREHRGSLENRLPWGKDVVQQEEASGITAPQPATLMAWFRTWALSAFRKTGHDSLTKAIRRFQPHIPAILFC